MSPSLRNIAPTDLDVIEGVDGVVGDIEYQDLDSDDGDGDDGYSDDYDSDADEYLESDDDRMLGPIVLNTFNYDEGEDSFSEEDD